MAPATVIALPLYLIFIKLHFIDTYIAIVLVHVSVSVPLTIWIMKGFFDEVPVEIDEASLIDGDSRFQAMVKQVIPLCAPGLLVTTAFCFINSWNEFFLALMLTGYNTRPLTVAVPALITPHGTYWGQVTAISTIGLLPGVFFAILARRYLLREITAGAVWR
jgi:multiple sugar transport system permease protein